MHVARGEQGALRLAEHLECGRHGPRTARVDKAPQPARIFLRWRAAARERQAGAIRGGYDRLARRVEEPPEARRGVLGGDQPLARFPRIAPGEVRANLGTRLVDERPGAPFGVPNPESYNIEVWHYDAATDALILCAGGDTPVHPSVTDTISITSLANGANIMWFEQLVDGGSLMTYYGLDDTGSFRLLHTLVSTAEPDHTMILDGEDLGPVDADDVWDGMFTDSYQVGGRYISLTNAFASRAEAERGEPSDSPGIAVSGDGRTIRAPRSTVPSARSGSCRTGSTRRAPRCRAPSATRRVPRA